MKALLNFLISIFAMGINLLAFALEYGPWNKHFAKVKFGMIVVEMRNKLNGHVFSRNRGGAYARGKVTPLNPNTSYQQTVRSRLTGLSQDWKGITQAQRDGWAAVVEQYAKTDVFGDLRNPSGQQLYIRLNANILNAGGAQITDAPQPVGADAVVAGALVMNSAGPLSTIDFTPTPVPATHALIVDATEGLSQGIQNANSKFRQIEVFAAAQASPADFSTTYETKFGTPIAGTKVFCRIKQIQTATGEVSGETTAYTTTL